jgi:hypothetical protein
VSIGHSLFGQLAVRLLSWRRYQIICRGLQGFFGICILGLVLCTPALVIAREHVERTAYWESHQG